MIARVIYEGQLGETISDVLPELISKARIIETYFYLVWNGVYLVISPTSTVEKLLDEYERKINHFNPKLTDKEVNHFNHN